MATQWKGREWMYSFAMGTEKRGERIGVAKYLAAWNFTSEMLKANVKYRRKGSKESIKTVNVEVICDVISSSLVSNSTAVYSRVVYSCHGDLQVASVQRDPDVRVVVQRQA